MNKSDHVRVRGLLTEAIRMLCKSSLQYKSELNVEGLLGITLDKNDIFLVNINECVTVGDKTKSFGKGKDLVTKRSLESTPAHTVEPVPNATAISSLPGVRSEGEPPEKKQKNNETNEENGAHNDDFAQPDHSDASSNTVIDVKPCVAEKQTEVASLDFGDMMAKYEPEDEQAVNNPLEDNSASFDSKDDRSSGYAYDNAPNANRNSDEEDDDIVVVKEEMAPANRSQEHYMQESQQYDTDQMTGSLLSHTDYMSHTDTHMASHSYGGPRRTPTTAEHSIHSTSPRRGRASGHSSRGRGRGRGTSVTMGHNPTTQHSMSMDPTKQMMKMGNTTYKTSGSTKYGRTVTETKFQCTFCDKLLSSSGSLRNHVIMKHTQDSSMHCPTCNKAFISSKAMAKHQVKCDGHSHSSPMAAASRSALQAASPRRAASQALESPMTSPARRKASQVVPHPSPRAMLPPHSSHTQHQPVSSSTPTRHQQHRPQHSTHYQPRGSPSPQHTQSLHPSDSSVNQYTQQQTQPHQYQQQQMFMYQQQQAYVQQPFTQQGQWPRAQSATDRDSAYTGSAIEDSNQSEATALQPDAFPQ